MKSNIILDTSNINNSISILKSGMEESRQNREKDLRDVENNTRETRETKETISGARRVELDENKHKSIISYINAPWGSGKTYFIEKVMNDKHFESHDMITLDSWVLKNGTTLESFLFNELNSIDSVSKEVEKVNATEYLKLKVVGEISKSLLKAAAFTSAPPIYLTVQKTNKFLRKKINTSKSPNQIKYESNINDANNEIIDKETIAKTIGAVEKIYSTSWNLIVFIDNIERLNTVDRLDVVNKILNWSAIKGIHFIFLTNFEKIKISTVEEEEFWDKICKYNNYNLRNNWNHYLENYIVKADEEKDEWQPFKENLTLREIAEISIETFFDTNEKSMDIRAIKKLLTHWKVEESTEEELVFSFILYIYNQIKGLDSHFYINKIISHLSNKNEFIKSMDDGEQLLELREMKYEGIINNKMLRIQSNFYTELEIEKRDKKIILSPDTFKKLPSNEIESFKNFNNLIDSYSYNLIESKVRSILATKFVLSENSELNTIFEEGNAFKNIEGKIKYFEFKYNNLLKLYLYNLMKKEIDKNQNN